MSGDPEKVQVEIEEVPEVKEEPAPVEEPAPAPVEEKEEPAAPVEEPASAPVEEKEEPAPAPAPVPVPAEEPVKAETAEVVKNVKEMLSSTEGKSVGDLENRVKVLEERLEKLISLLKNDCDPCIKLIMKSL
jgi:outer membrane biosynthesis protein TonB